MTPDRKITLSIPGSFDYKGFNEVLAEASKIGLAANRGNASNPEVEFAQSLGDYFIEMIANAMKYTGQMDGHGVVEARGLVKFEMPDEARDSPYEMMKYAWTERAKDWVGVESPVIYRVTIETLLEFFRVRGAPEKILSLGSGPGLYEIFLASVTRDLPDGRHSRFICSDYAEGMVKKCQELLGVLTFKDDLGFSLLNNVTAQVEDMTALSFADGTIGQIICNNSLQWTSDWKKAVAEMRRVLDPNGIGFLYLFINNHPMRVRDQSGDVVLTSGDFTVENLLDELEDHGFQIHRTRQMMGRKGMGQFGGELNRTFILANSKEGVTRPWRTTQGAASLAKRSL